MSDGWQAGDLKFLDTDGDNKISIGRDDLYDADGNKIPPTALTTPETA